MKGFWISGKPSGNNIAIPRKIAKVTGATKAFIAKCQPKVIRHSNPDFRINPDPHVWRIGPKLVWIHYVVGVSRFAEFHTSRPVRDCMRNAKKSLKIPLFRNGGRNGKLIQNPHPASDQHQKLTTSRWSPLAHACLLRYRVRELSCSVDRQTAWQTVTVT